MVLMVMETVKGFKFEICYSKSGGARFDAAEKNAARFIAQLLKERGWGVDKVKKHQDFSNKYCPHRTLDIGWASFVNMVKDYLNELNAPATKTFLVQIICDELNIRQKANFTSKVVGTVNVAKSIRLLPKKMDLVN